MAIMSSKLDDKFCLTITVRGRFDYHSSGKFRHHYEKYGDKPSKFIIDMTQMESLDSTAIGLLLMLKGNAGDKKEVILKNPNEIIERVLNVSKIDRMFTIESP